MFTIAEITRLDAISIFYAPTLYPFVVATKLYYGKANEDIATFWSDTFGVTEPLQNKTFITGIVYKHTINYSKKDTQEQCLIDFESYHWNSQIQYLTIRLGLTYTFDYINYTFDKGIAIGLTNDKLRYFDNMPYYPFLLTTPIIEQSVDKFNYDQLSFIVASLQCDNKTGFFNIFKTTSIYGNKVSIKTGENGDTYTDLIERVTFYVEDYSFSVDIFDIAIQDIRKTLTAQIPNKILNIIDYPQLGDHSIGKTIKFGYGQLHDVPGMCVNENALDSEDPKFLFLEIITAVTKVYVKNTDDAWVEDAAITVDLVTGLVTVPSAKTGSSPNYNVLSVKADLTGIENTYASDIIKDLNERFLNLTYDSSNYDTVECEETEIKLDTIGLYMNTTKNIYEWIKEIQSLSTIGFKYTTTADNRRTIHLDNPNKDIVAVVPAIHVKNIALVKAESNKDDVYNKVYIGYNYSIENDSAPRIEITDYFDESFAEYKIERVYNKISGLLDSTAATKRARIQAEDYYKIHRVFELILIGAQYLNLQLYDIITVNLSLQNRTLIINDAYIEVLDGASTAVEELLTTDKYLDEQFDYIQTVLVGDTYFDTIRGQIISIKPDYLLQTNTIKLRQRDYSTVWEDIYG